MTRKVDACGLERVQIGLAVALSHFPRQRRSTEKRMGTPTVHPTGELPPLFRDQGEESGV
jgi:hypothetical protein